MALANAYRNSKKTEYSDKSAKYLDEAIRILPNRGQGYFNYAVLYFYLAQYQKALESYTKSVSLQSWYANKEFIKSINDSIAKK